jgi:hypothetical protein
MSEKTNVQIQCCICGSTIAKSESDGYSLQVRKMGADSPEMIWAHGECLRKVIPVISAEIPAPQKVNGKN